MSYEIGMVNPRTDDNYWDSCGREFDKLFCAFKNFGDYKEEKDMIYDIPVSVLSVLDTISTQLNKNSDYVTMYKLGVLDYTGEYAYQYYCDGLSAKEQGILRSCFYCEDAKYHELVSALLLLFEGGYYNIVTSLTLVYNTMLRDGIETFNIYSSY